MNGERMATVQVLYVDDLMSDEPVAHAVNNPEGLWPRTYCGQNIKHYNSAYLPRNHALKIAKECGPCGQAASAEAGK